MNMKKIIKEKSIYIAAFMIPWLLIFVNAIIRNGWPLGESVILRADSGLQYFQLCVELWDKVHNNGSLFYSWHACGGIDFYLNFAYYLISPFNILMLVVPRYCLEDTVQIVMILKWCGIYISFVYYFMNTNLNKIKKKRGLVSFILGSVVALSNSVLIDIAFFNWNDVIMLFPILLLQVEKIVEGEKTRKYYIFLSIAMICNFYMAYQVCIFLFIWFLGGILISKNTLKDIINKILYFTINSFLSAVTSSIVIVPCIKGVSGRYINYNNERVYEYINGFLFSFHDFVSKLFIFNNISDVSQKPNIYFSIGALVFMLLYISVKSSDKKKNIIILLLLVCGLFIGVFSYVLHGFSVPHGIYHRYAYMISFMVAIIIMEIIPNLSMVKWKKICIGMIVFDFIIIYALLNITDYLESFVYLITFLLLIVYESIIILFLKGSISKRVLLKIFGLIVFIELFFNAEYQLKNYNVQELFGSFKTKEAGRLAEKADLSPGERMNILEGLRNNGMLFGFDCNEGYVSYTNGSLISLCTNIGMDYYDDAGQGLIGASPVINILFNTRYGIGYSDMLFSDYEVVDNIDNINLYRFKHISGLGYMVNESIADWDTNKVAPFDIQNEFINLSTNSDEKVFEIVKPVVKCSNNDGILKPIDQYTKAGFYLYEYNYTDIHNREYTLLDYEVTDNMDMYMVINNGKKAITNVFVDDKMVFADSFVHNQQTLHIGKVSKGQKIKIYSFHDMNNGDSNVMWCQFAKYNDDIFQKNYSFLSKNVLQIDEKRDTYVKGNIHVDKGGIMMTSIPAFSGYTVYVDGKPCDYQIIGNTFIGVPLDEGDHIVEFRYSTPYFKAGLIGSVIGVLLYFFLSFPLTKLYSGGTLYKDVSTLKD